jgi:hypothetical protein
MKSGLVPEGRLIVAQHEVLGNDVKDTSIPRTIERSAVDPQAVSRAQITIDRPSGTYRF